jgi:Fic-DOC domain mobile mystery protein B
MPFSSIPGETPIDDISRLRIKTIATRRELNQAEAININLALRKYISVKPSSVEAPFTYAWMLDLHREMFGEVWEWAGEIRNRNLNFGIEFHLIREELMRLTEDVQAWRRFQVPMQEQSSRLHHTAVRIHPFENGNGRWARLLTNIWLLRNDQPIIAWPDHAIQDTSIIREAYIAALRRADNGYFEELELLHATYQATG